LPVRSALFKQRTGGLVVRWVATGESPLLYVFVILLPLFSCVGKKLKVVRAERSLCGRCCGCPLFD
ncbi:hypothetical protein GQ44DRAFT_631217, partial [Phaeosphaeriaceae sp. PMI808]